MLLIARIFFFGLPTNLFITEDFIEVKLNFLERIEGVEP